MRQKALKRIAQISYALWRGQPLSFFGIIALMLSILSLMYLAIIQNDLVAYVVSGISLFLIGFSLLGTFYLRFRTARLLTKVDSEPVVRCCFSKSPFRVKYIISKIHLWPFWVLNIEYCFAVPGAQATKHLITGSFSSKDVLRLDSIFFFPHRGFWVLKTLKLQISDRLGISRLSCYHDVDDSIEVAAKDVLINSLPVQIPDSSSGDLFNLENHRQGDLYDIKQYDPSDGLKKILWKVYARSGQLVVRRPEPAVIPQGKLAIYLVARPEDDHVAGAIQSYTEILKTHNIAVVFGTDGSSRSIQEPLIRTTINAMAMHPLAGTGTGIKGFLDELVKSANALEVVIFTASDNTSWIKAESAQLPNASLKFNVVLVNNGKQTLAKNFINNNYGWTFVECDIGEK